MSFKCHPIKSYSFHFTVSRSKNFVTKNNNFNQDNYVAYSDHQEY